MKNKKTDKKRGWLIILALAAVVVLAACASQVLGESATDETSTMAQAQDNAAMQLAAGTLTLQETENAITAEQAPELLTLWNAYATLSEADGVAEAELNAVLDTITDTMTDAQVAAIQSAEIDMNSMSGMMAAERSSDESDASSGMTRGGGEGMGSGPGGGDVTQLTEEQITEMRAEREASGTSPMVLNVVNHVIEMLEALA